MNALVGAVCASGFSRPPVLTPSEWAAKFRRLPETSAAAGGRWRNETAPYLTGIMDAFTEGVRLIAVMKAAQTGVSEAMLNAVAYHVAHRPCPILVCLPTAGAAVAFSKDRVQDMIRSTPEVGRLIADKRRPGRGGLPESTLSQRLFPGGQLVTLGASSPNSFARWSARIVIADDCDRIARYIGAEGDPEKLLTNRTQTFHDGIVCFISTPVDKGGRIESIYARTDQRRYMLQCGGCGSETWVTWNDKERWRVAFDGHDQATARLQHACGFDVPESGRAALVQRGRWVATFDAPETAGFHVPAMLSPFTTLAELAGKFIAANVSGNVRRLREFVTTALGEGWRDESTSVEVGDLDAHLEDF